VLVLPGIGHAESPLLAISELTPEVKSSWVGPTSTTVTAGLLPASPRPATGCEVEHFGMDQSVVLGQDLSEVAGPVRDGAVADLAAGDRKLGNGHREAAAERRQRKGDLLIWPDDARPVGARCSRRTRHAA